MFSKENDKRFIKSLKTNSCRTKPKNWYRRPKSRSLPKRNIPTGECYLTELQTLEETTKRLAKKRKEADEERERLDGEWTALTFAELELQDNFKIFSKFLRENAEKNRRNLRRSENYTRQIIRRQMAIDRLTEVLGIGWIIKDELLEELDKHLIYEKFLTDAAQLLNVKHLISVVQKFQRYLDTREVGTKLSAERYVKIQHFAAEYKRIVFEKHETVLKMFEKLSSFSANYREIHRKVYKWETVVKDIQNYVTKLYLDVETTTRTLEDIITIQFKRLLGRKSGIVKSFCHIEHFLETREGQFVGVKRILKDLEIVRNRISLYVRKSGPIVDKVDDFLEKNNASNFSSTKKNRRPRSNTAHFPLISSKTAKILDNISVKYTGHLWGGRNHFKVTSQQELPIIHGVQTRGIQPANILSSYESSKLPILNLSNNQLCQDQCLGRR